MSIENKVRAYESFPTIENAKEVFSGNNKPFLVKNLTDIYNAESGIYKIQNLTLLMSYSNYIIHIDEDDSYRSVISFMDWFDESKILDIVDNVVSKKVYKDNVERLFSAVLVHLLLNNNFDMAVKFIRRIMYYSTENDTYIKRAFDNINFVNAAHAFNSKIAYLTLLLVQQYPEIKISKRMRISNLICISDFLKDYITDISGDCIVLYSNILKNNRKYLKPLTRLPVSFKHNSEKFIDTIESNSNSFFEVCNNLSYYWNSKDYINIIRKAYNIDSIRLLNNIIRIFNNTPNNKLLIDERARKFLHLNEKCDFLNAMDTIMPALNDNLQTAILKEML